MLEQLGESILVGSFVLPASEVANVTMLEPYGPASADFQNGVIQANGKEHIDAPFDLLMESSIHFSLNPSTINSMLGQNEQEFVLEVNSLFETTQDWCSRAEVMRCKPARNIFFAQVGIELLGNGFVLARIADKQ